MKGKFPNLILISEKDGIRNYIISYKALLSYISLFFFIYFLIVFSSAYVIYYFKSSKNDYNLLRHALKEEMKGMNNEVEIIRKSIKEINLIIKDDLVSVPDKKYKEYGTGGGENQSYNNEIDYELNEEIMANVLKIKLDLFKKIDNLNDELNNLLLNLKNIKKKLSSIPVVFPTMGIITSGFGYRKSPFSGKVEFHRGIDIMSKEGTPVITTADGIVKDISTNSLLGLNVLISHSNNTETQYGHLKEVCVKVGQKLKEGDVIGKIGSTGRSTGPHLHYQVMIDGIPINPMDYIVYEYTGRIF